jgi:hypothetical protein
MIPEQQSPPFIVLIIPVLVGVFIGRLWIRVLLIGQQSFPVMTGQ